MLWTAAYVMLGFIFAHQLDGVGPRGERFGTMLAVVVGVPLLLYVAWRRGHLWRMVRQLRLRRISS